MGAIPFPIPPPPVTRPGGWHATRDAPGPAPGDMPGDAPGGPTLGQVWKRIKDAAGAKPDARPEPRVETRDTDCSQTSDQNNCNACKLAQGFMVPANYTIPLPQYRNYDYQLRIANRGAAPEQFQYTYGGTTLDRGRLKLFGGKNQITITEWSHGGIRFDGFWRGSCTAIETKGHYKQFFDENGDLHFWASLDKKSLNILERWEKQFRTHHAHITGLGPPAKLEWHFLEHECYAIARKLFRKLSSACRYTP